MKPLSVGLILLILVCRLFSQKDATISILTVNDGLSQGMIFDILQSKDGFIWMATKDGLNRYDGSRFEVFSPDPFNPYSISSSEINSLFEDRNGLIWVSTPEMCIRDSAGTPGISDPGFLLVRECVANGIKVSCLPGATAFVPALVSSGMTTDKFYFEGFLPHKKGRQTRWKYLTTQMCIRDRYLHIPSGPGP